MSRRFSHIAVEDTSINRPCLSIAYPPNFPRTTTLRAQMLHSQGIPCYLRSQSALQVKYKCIKIWDPVFTCNRSWKPCAPDLVWCFNQYAQADIASIPADILHQQHRTPILVKPEKSYPLTAASNDIDSVFKPSQRHWKPGPATGQLCCIPVQYSPIPHMRHCS